MTKVKQRTSRLLIAALTLILTVGLIAAMPTDVHAQGGETFTEAKYLPFGEWDKGGVTAIEAAFYKIKTKQRPGMSYKITTDGMGKSEEISLTNMDNEELNYYKETGDSNSLHNQYYYLRPNRSYVVATWLVGTAGGYRIKATCSLPSWKLTSLTSGKKKLTVKFRSKKGATEYRIKYKRYGSQYNWPKKAQITVKASSTKYVTKAIKNLKSGKKYAVRVLPVRKASGSEYLGKWSKYKISKKVK